MDTIVQYRIILAQLTFMQGMKYHAYDVEGGSNDSAKKSSFSEAVIALVVALSLYFSKSQ